MALFKRWHGRKPQRNDGERARVAQMVCQQLAWVGNSVPSVTVSEIDCGDPACPGLETVILVFLPGHPTKAFKIAKRMGDVAAADLAPIDHWRAALASNAEVSASVARSA